MRALLIVMLLAAPASADDIIRGAIVKVEHEEIYVNLGTKQGVGDGASLRIKRTINLKHPVSRAAIIDWIPIASATITQTGGGLSRAVIGQLIERVRVGDVVEALVTADSAAPPVETPKPRPNDPPPLPVDPQVATVLAIFAQQSGLSIDARIAAWERYLSTNKQSPFAAAIQQDVEVLQGLREQMKSPDPTATDVVVEQLHHDAPKTADAGAPIPLVFMLDAPERVASAYLHYRARGSKTFTRTLLARENDIYLRGAVPASAVKPPGVDYFVEVSAPNGTSGLAFASPGNPTQVSVRKPAIVDRFEEKTGRTTVTLSAEYLDFATFDKRDGDRRDRMYNASIDMGYRIDSYVQRVGVGYGAIGGQGGFKNITFDPSSSPIPESGYHYGYADIEAGHPKYGTLGGKLIAGVGKNGFGMGVEGRLRYGKWDGTNIQATGRNIPDVGWHTDVRLGTSPAEDWLLGLVVGATNQPNKEETAAKLATEFQWIGSKNVSVLVRGSWQGRSSIHSGIGGGASLGFTW